MKLLTDLEDAIKFVNEAEVLEHKEDLVWNVFAKAERLCAAMREADCGMVEIDVAMTRTSEGVNYSYPMIELDKKHLCLEGKTGTLFFVPEEPADAE